jgi:hypothetical protein
LPGRPRGARAASIPTRSPGTATASSTSIEELSQRYGAETQLVGA